MDLGRKIAGGVLMFLRHIRWMGAKHPFWFVRNPKPPKLSGCHYRKLASLLRPGDILLTRMDGYVSTWLVPGFWTHAGMFIGERDGQPERVSEAVGEGVRLSDLVDFLREDYVAVIRVKDERNEDSIWNAFPSVHENAVTLAMMQVRHEKEYDHLFDFLEGERVSCTEHVSINYPSKGWGKRRFGAWRVIADDIYEYAKARPDEFEIIYESRDEYANI